jgi:uncharacterized membrane protein YraQ (UPF0718 family)
LPEQPQTALPKGKRRVGIDWGFLIVIMLSLGSMIWVMAREGVSVAQRILLEDAWLFLSILPKVLLGCAIGGFVRLLIARETIEKHVGEGSGVKGLAIAAGIGTLFPAGPFTIFPLAAVMVLSGADRGAAIAFVSGWLLLGINRAIIWEMPFFGMDFVLFRFLISMPMPILLGLLARSRLFDRWFTKLEPKEPTP